MYVIVALNADERFYRTTLGLKGLVRREAYAKTCLFSRPLVSNFAFVMDRHFVRRRQYPRTSERMLRVSFLQVKPRLQFLP
jgi:hypothetical protein